MNFLSLTYGDGRVAIATHYYLRKLAVLRRALSRRFFLTSKFLSEERV
jgi:hypothetical protein